MNKEKELNLQTFNLREFLNQNSRDIDVSLKQSQISQKPHQIKILKSSKDVDDINTPLSNQ